MEPTEIMYKVAEIDPNTFLFIKEASVEINKGPFSEELKIELDHIIKKAAAAWTNLSKTMGNAANFLGNVGASAGTAALGGIALALAGDAYNAAKRGLTKSRNYKAMLEENPDLRELPVDRVQRAFTTLHRMNPVFSSDPTVAGAFIRRQTLSEIPEWNPNELKTLIDSHKNLQDNSQLPNFDPRIPGSMSMHPLQMEKLRQDTDADFQYEKNRSQHELHEAQKKKVDFDRLMAVEKRINERAAMAAKAKAHRRFSPI